MNVLYDKDYFKLALGQINNARRLVDNISSDYLRLLKYGDSLYRCKQLKRAALGRMVKVIRRQENNLKYLEEVRQHMARLPNIDPNTRTLLICGYPNVGKSSFMNKITRANVDVQPYAFTTKSLFVGHTDYKLLRWQVIDTPGILDHPIEDRNVIEMQSITALAHLRCSILFVIDVSEQCNYTISQQVALFESIAPLFEKKPLIVVLNKIDIRRIEDLNDEENSLIQGILKKFPEAKILPMSSHSEEGVSQVKETSCELLLAIRAEMKLKGIKRDQILNRLHVAMPQPRDDVQRPVYIPQSFIEKDGPESGKIARMKLKEFEEQDHKYMEMDPDYTGMDWRKYYLLENDDWRYDIVPEIMDGENIIDWIDPDLQDNLAALEAEEAELLRQIAASPVEFQDSLTPEEAEALARIRNKKSILIQRSRLKKLRNSRLLPLKNRTGTASQFSDHLTSLGLDPTKSIEHIREVSRSRERGRKRGRDEILVSKERSTSKSVGKISNGFKNEEQKKKAQKLENKSMALINRKTGRSGPGDNSIPTLRPKHLFSGKSSMGKSDHR